MKAFESKSSDFLSNIFKIRIRIKIEIIMNIFSPFIAPEIQIDNTNEIFMNINQEIFKSKLDFDQINSTKSPSILIEFILISIESSSILAQLNLVTVEIILTLTKTKTPKTIKLTNAFTFINISKNSKFLFSKFVRDKAMTNSIKKRKSNEMKKILLFSFDLSQQKIKQVMQQIKVALTTAYSFVENADILITIDFINQIIDGKSKIFEKFNTGISTSSSIKFGKKIDFSKNSHEQFFKGKKFQSQAKTAISLSTIAVVRSLSQEFKSGHFISSFLKTIKKINLALFFKFSSWAETAKHTKSIFDASWTEVRRKSFKSSNKSNMIERKKKLLIIILNQDIFNYDSYKYRKKVNSAFKKVKINVQIVTITKSVSGKNIVMIIVESNIVDQLLEHRSIWNDIFKPKHVVNDEIGHQFIVNYINVEQFNDMKTLQSEIETYNSIKLKFASRGLSKEIDNKMHLSIVVTISSHNDAKIIKSGLNVEDIRCKTNKYNSTQPIIQCMKCQKFEHLHTICKNDAKCEICVHKHETNKHMCITCKSKNSCSHIVPKCANCNEAHVAKSTKCEIFLALRSKNASNNVEKEL